VETEGTTIVDLPVRAERFGAEDPLALRVQQAAPGQLIDGASRLEGRVQLDQGFGPEESALELLIDVIADPLVGDVEAGGVLPRLRPASRGSNTSKRRPSSCGARIPSG
jgi:hypothetical protein